MKLSDFHDELDEGKLADFLGKATFAAVMATAGHNAYSEIKNSMTPIDQDKRPASVSLKLDDPVPYREKKQKNLSDAKLLALTIWGEARNHGTEGMRAVGHVIMNRVNAPRNFGKTIRDVVWRRKAFSCWNPGDPNRQAMKEIGQLNKGSPDYRRWVQAKKIAAEILSRRSHDPTNGALFYHTKSIRPEWSKGVKPVSVVADHVFYTRDHKKDENA